jgi:hypothetical protein
VVVAEFEPVVGLAAALDDVAAVEVARAALDVGVAADDAVDFVEVGDELVGLAAELELEGIAAAEARLDV